MTNLVKVKVLRDFQDTTLGHHASGGFYKVDRAKADHFIENGLAEEIVVQNKMQPATVTETKPKPQTATFVKAPSKPAKGKTDGKHSDTGKGKGPASRRK